VAQRDSNQNLAMASVWPPQGKTLAVRGFDAAGDSIAIVSETEALWCSPPQIGLTLECDTVIADDLPGPVALSPDGRSYWLGMGDGSVRRWQRASPSSVRSELRGIAAAGSELHLLRAFESVLYVGRDKQVDAYSIASVPEKRQSYPFQADAIERCDASRAYALNDGQLVYANGDSDFEVVPDQPAFVRSIACDGAGDLIGVGGFARSRLDVVRVLQTSRPPCHFRVVSVGQTGERDTRRRQSHSRSRFSQGELGGRDQRAAGAGRSAT
jgi:hypothetical protein